MAYLTTKYDRLAPLAKELKQCASYRTIGAMIGISGERVRQILLKADRDAARPEWMHGLEIKTAHVLMARGFTSKAQLQDAIDRGETIANVKAVRLETIKKWLTPDAIPDKTN